MTLHLASAKLWQEKETEDVVLCRVLSNHFRPTFLSSGSSPNGPPEEVLGAVKTAGDEVWSKRALPY